VDHENLGSLRRSGSIVAVGNPERGQPRPGDELEWPKVTPKDAPGPKWRH